MSELRRRMVDRNPWSKKDHMELETTIYTNIYKDTTSRFYGIWHLLLRWKGSVYKLIWHEVLIFLIFYFALSILYRAVLFENETYRQTFELLCIYAGRFSGLIPISFLTGFYVTQVVTRWWSEFLTLPWPDKIAFRLVSYIPGKDLFRKNLRRTVIRYVNLSTVLVYRLVSFRVQQRFPTWESIIDAKLMLPHEVERLKGVQKKTPHEYTWVPILWACKLIQRARTEGKITIEPPVFANLISSLDYIEESNRNVLNYGWINFPLAYTQVASISVFLYFLAALFGRQYLVPQPSHLDNSTFPASYISTSINSSPFKEHTPDFYFPFFTIVEFISYMGWIKVAETLLNPFGDDDEDFEINYMIDRNLQTSYLIVDEAEEELEMCHDPFLEAGITVPQAEDLPEYKMLGRKLSRKRNSITGKLTSISTPKMGRKRHPVPIAEEGEAEDGDTRPEDSSVLYKTVNEDLHADSEVTVTPDGSRRLSIIITPTSPNIGTPEGSPWSQGSRNGSGRVNKNFVVDEDDIVSNDKVRL